MWQLIPFVCYCYEHDHIAVVNQCSCKLWLNCCFVIESTLKSNSWEISFMPRLPELWLQPDRQLYWLVCSVTQSHSRSWNSTELHGRLKHHYSVIQTGHNKSYQNVGLIKSSIFTTQQVFLAASAGEQNMRAMVWTGMPGLGTGERQERVECYALLPGREPPAGLPGWQAYQTDRHHSVVSRGVETPVLWDWDISMRTLK